MSPPEALVAGGLRLWRRGPSVQARRARGEETQRRPPMPPDL